MPTTYAEDHPSALGIAARVAGLTLLGAATVLALMFAAAAAVVIGLVVAGAAIALRFAPRPAEVASETLEARRTPAGWVVETRTRRPS